LNKYHQFLDTAIVMTSICSVGLATLAIADDRSYVENNNDTVKNIQLERLDNSLTSNSQNSDISSFPEKARQLKHQTANSPILLKHSQPKPVSIIAINLIKEFEGFKDQAYIDSDGTPVIGYGLSRIAGKPVKIGDRIDSKQADAALNAQLQEIHQQLDSAIKVELSDRQLSALASLSFNVGIMAIKTSTLVRKINAGDYVGAANEFLRWDKANLRGQIVQMPGLTRRRQVERQLFLQ
jgi:lysozyme